MHEFFAHGWDMLIGRQDGPLNFRLIVQPIIATILAIRAGFREARVGNPPFLWALLTHPGHRLTLLRAGWKDVGMVFGMAILIDAGYQIYVFRWIYPLQVLIVAALLAFLPYCLVCGPVNRIARRWYARGSRSPV